MKTCVVLPTFNEAENVGDIINRILASALIDEIIIVDDASIDATEEIVKSLSQNDPRIRLLSRRGRKSFAGSYLDGFRLALAHGAEIIIQMDADGSHDPAAIGGMMESLRACDLVIGSRYIKGGEIKKWNFIRRLVSYYGNLYARFLLNSGIKDMTGGFCAWRTDSLRKIDLGNLNMDGYVFQILLKWQASKMGARIKEFPITFAERKKGKTKFSARITLEAAYGVLLMNARLIFRRRFSRYEPQIIAPIDAVPDGFIDKSEDLAEISSR